jgi:hypothetical protein
MQQRYGGDRFDEVTLCRFGPWRDPGQPPQAIKDTVRIL